MVPDGNRTAAAPRRANGGWSRGSLAAPDLARLARWTGRPLVAVGLLMALLSKGCEALNLHASARAAAVAKAAPEQFDEDRQFKELVLQNEIDALRPRDDAKPDERKADERKRDEVRKQLRDYQAESAKDRRGKETGEWHDLNIAARLAKRSFP